MKRGLVGSRLKRVLETQSLNTSFRTFLRHGSSARPHLMIPLTWLGSHLKLDRATQYSTTSSSPLWVLFRESCPGTSSGRAGSTLKLVVLMLSLTTTKIA